MDSFVPRCETNDSLGRSSIVAPTKLLQWFLRAIPNVGLREVSCNKNQTLVTGLNLPRLHYEDHPHACFHKGSSKRSSLQHPDYSLDATRFKSFKYWNGLIPPRELVEAGFYMMAPNLVRCFSCNVVVHVLDWNRGDDAVNIHYSRSPNCSFLEELLNRIRIYETLRDGAGIKYSLLHSCSEKPMIKDRVKKEGSSVNNSLSVTSKTEHPSSTMPDSVSKVTSTVSHLVIPPNQQSMSTLVNLPKSSTKSTDAITYSPPREQIILSERLCEVADSGGSVGIEEGRFIPKCKRCHIQPVEYIFLPCGDAKMCERCARKVFNCGQPCFACNQPVGSIHPIYL